MVSISVDIPYISWRYNHCKKDKDVKMLSLRYLHSNDYWAPRVSPKSVKQGFQGLLLYMLLWCSIFNYICNLQRTNQNTKEGRHKGWDKLIYRLPSPKATPCPCHWGVLSTSWLLVVILHSNKALAYLSHQTLKRTQRNLRWTSTTKDAPNVKHDINGSFVIPLVI